jgi:predicted permease
MIQDLLYAFRTLRRDRALVAMVALSIGLGIAVNTTVFSMVNATVLGALPVRDPAGLHTVSGGRTFSLPTYRAFRDECTGIFEGLSAHCPFAPANLAGDGAPERVWGSLVSGNYFSVAGVPLTLGRGIAPADDAVDGASPVLVLGNGLWRRRFGADPAVIGRAVILNGRRYTVVGVTIPGFLGTDRGIVPEFWAPMAMRGDFMADLLKHGHEHSSSWLIVNGRLKPGVTREQAVAALNVVHARDHEEHYKGQTRKPVTLVQAGGVPMMGNGVAGFMALLSVVVGLVLLIACANVSNLLLGRAVDRRQEISIRLAVGASRWRLVRQFLTESVLLSSLGAALGFLLAWAATRALAGFRFPIPLPIAFDFTPDARVVAYTAALAVASGVLFGVIPAWIASRMDLTPALKNSGVGFGSFRSFGLRNLLVGLQVTLSALLLIGSGLFLRSLQHASSMELGIRPENVLIASMDPRGNRYSPARIVEFLRELEQRVAALDGVRSVAAVNILPLTFIQSNNGYRDAEVETRNASSVETFHVSGRYFETIGLPLLRGRDFDSTRDLKSAAVIVNRTLARKLYGEADPIGRRVRARDRILEIVGVVGDSKAVSLGEETKACAYHYLPANPEEIIGLVGLTLLVRTTGDPARMIQPVRAQIQEIDASLAVYNANTMRQHVANAFLIPRLCATLFGVFGLLGLTLASVGLYGVVSYSVRSRTREIGIRMALGARASEIVRLMLQQGLAIVAAGLALGVGAGYFLSRFTASLLYGISARDAVTFVGVPAVLAAAALAAIFVPARRAAAVEPMNALRLE